MFLLAHVNQTRRGWLLYGRSRAGTASGPLTAARSYSSWQYATARPGADAWPTKHRAAAVSGFWDRSRSSSTGRLRRRKWTDA